MCPPCLFYLHISIFYFYEYALLGAAACWGRGRSRFAGYPLSHHTSIVLAEGGEPTRPSRLFCLKYFLQVCPLGGQCSPGTREIPACRVSLVLSHVYRVWGTDASVASFLFTSIYFLRVCPLRGRCSLGTREIPACRVSLVLSHVYRVQASVASFLFTSIYFL